MLFSDLDLGTLFPAGHRVALYSTVHGCTLLLLLILLFQMYSNPHLSLMICEIIYFVFINSQCKLIFILI